MGLFDLIGSVANIAIKTVSTPITITSDIIGTVIGNEPKNTKNLMKSIEKDIDNISNDLIP